MSAKGFWDWMERAPVEATRHEWNRRLGMNCERVTTVVLRHTERDARWMSCPEQCCGGHRLVPQPDGGFLAICNDDEPMCEDVFLTTDEGREWEMDYPRLGRLVARALELAPRDVEMDSARCRQIGTFSGMGLPVVMVLPGSTREFRESLTQVFVRLREQFIVLAPTGRFMDATCHALLKSAKAGFFDLESLLRLEPDGTLRPLRSPEGLFPGMGQEVSVHPAKAPPARPRYALRQGLGVWKVTFDSQEAELKDERGLAYVAHLLKNPPAEPIHGVELAAQVAGYTPIQELSLGREDAATLRAIRREAAELATVLDSDDVSEMEKEEARARLDELADCQKQAGSRTESNAEKTVRAVRKAIQRLHERLSAAKDENGRSHPVFRPFAEHLEKHLLIPSSRYSGRKGARTVAGVAGCFTYEPPDGITWAD